VDNRGLLSSLFGESVEVVQVEAAEETQQSGWMERTEPERGLTCADSRNG
jgi:hypothetical protein